MSAVVTDEVAAALANGQPVVALESTIIAHGLPYPDNLELARALEDDVRAGGAVPATIAVIDGHARIGLDAAALERLATGGAAVAKAGAGDLAVHLAAGGAAATTVSGTSLLAAHAGIRLFATGGIGGVHRGDDGDVSNDLETVARLPICVVSAGAKAILDLPRTLELLETLGVPVIGYRTGELPAFWSRSSGLVLEHRVDSAGVAARVLRARWAQLGQGGVLLCNPVPEAAEVPRERAEVWIAGGLAAAADGGVGGKALTPFLLAHIARASGGEAVAANVVLARANARLAAEVAVAYAVQ